MDEEVVLGLLKIASALIGGALGIAGLLADYRTRSGKLTRAGIAVLVGILISAVVGVVASGIEAQKARTANREQAARTEVVLKELSRSILPIRQLEASYWLQYPRGSKTLDSYIERVSTGIHERLALLSGPLTERSKENNLTKGLSPWAREMNGNVLHVSIKKESDLWPRAKDEPVLVSHLMIFPLIIDFFKEPINPEEYRPIHGASDFSATSFGAKRAEIDWDLKRKRLVLIGNSVFEKTSWKTNGKISSIVDLYGAQMLFFLPNSSKFAVEGIQANDLNSESRFLAENMSIVSISFDFGDGHTIRLTGKKFKKTGYKGGYPVYSVIFPKTEKEFSEFVRDTSDD